MKIAVITGASSGMGREFVKQLDARELFDEVWVIARRADRLEELKGSTRAAVRPLALDLTKNESLEEYKTLLAEINPEVAVLVNASGFGKFGAFTKLPLDEQLNMIDLNDKALVAITHITLPFMTVGGRIFQLGSLSSFQPVPFMSIYAASKAFVLSFSRGLNKELERQNRGIRVMAVCPGWIKTEFFDRAVLDDTVKYYSRFYTPDEVVTCAIRDMEKKRGVSILGLPEKLQCLLVKHVSANFTMNVWCKQQKL